MQIRQAEKSKSKLRIGLSGPSGSGKTYSALLIASGMTSWEKICVIDTENNSADLYSDLGKYNVITLEAPFSPERYIEAIKAAQDAGMEVVIVDSVTHEWDGKGGCLESNELLAQTKFKGNSWAAWSATTPRHQSFIESLVTSTCHVITTARSKTDTIQTEDKKIKKVGLKEIQREGFEYELTVNMTLDRDGHFAIASKDRTGMFIDKDPFVITAEVGKQLLEWANKGIDTTVIAQNIEELMKVKGVSLENTVDYYKVKSLADLPYSRLKTLEDKLNKMPDKPEETKNPPQADETTPEPPVKDIKVEDTAPSGTSGGSKPAESATDSIFDPDPAVVEDEPMATPGQIKMFELGLKKRAAQIKKGYDNVLKAYLDKMGIERISQLTTRQIKDATDKIVQLNTDFANKNRLPTEEEAMEMFGGDK